MSQSVTDYLDNLDQPWQAELCRALHRTVHDAVPDVVDRLQCGKPHYLKDGTYACVLGTARGWVSLTIFNGAGLDAPEGLFEPGSPERKSIKIRQGEVVDYALPTKLLRQAGGTIRA